jgi:hypothetical protein
MDSSLSQRSINVDAVAALCCNLQVQKMKVAQEDQARQRPQRAQTLYNFGLCLWLLSFDDNGMIELQRPASLIPLVNLLKEGELLYSTVLVASFPPPAHPIVLQYSSIATYPYAFNQRWL